MSTFLSLIALCVLLVFQVNCESPETPMAGVVDLTPSNYKDYLGGDYNAFVEFYAPWCGHCKNLAPEYAKVGEAMDKFKPKDTVLAKVNCDEHRSICSEFGVQGYPTLKFFKKGSSSPQDYNSGRTAADIVNYLKDEAGARVRLQETPSFVKVLTPGNFDSIVGQDANVLVEFYAPWCGHCKKLAPDYEKVAETFQREGNCIVAKVDADKHRSLAEKYDVKGFPTIKFFKAGSSEPEAYNQGRTPEEFVDYLNDKCGTSRQVGGLPSNTAGLVVSLNKISQKFLSASEDKRQSLLEQAKEEVDQISSDAKRVKAGRYYVKVMNKISQKGNDYVEKESARLQRMKDEGKMLGDQLDWLQTRINILSKFD